MSAPTKPLFSDPCGCSQCGHVPGDRHADGCPAGPDDVDVIATPDKPDVFSALTDVEYALRQLRAMLERASHPMIVDHTQRAIDALERAQDALSE